MTLEWNKNKFESIWYKSSVLAITLFSLVLIEALITEFSPIFLTILIIILMIVLAYIQYLFIFSIRTRNSKAILENLELRYIEPNTGYEISIRKKDIKNSHFKRYIFNKLILELSGNQRLTLINLSNLKILQEQINAL